MSIEFFATSLIVVLIPGTGVLYTVSSALAGGWRTGNYAAIGCTLGILPHLLAAMVGLSGVMQAGATAFEVVRYVGVAYLVFMGVMMIRESGAFDLHAPEAPARSMLLVVRRGILLNLLNPKLTVFFFAFLPQFLDRSAGPLDPRLAGLSIVFMAMTLAVFVGYAYLSAAARQLVLGAPAVRRWLHRSFGALLIGFGARLATADR
jgi:threonine/homoserine/homoserine lactone efflux protein